MSRTLRILIADDNRDAADSLAKCLNLFGYKTQVAYDGQEAFEQAHLRVPDVFLIDIAMPKVGGFELVSRLRHDKKFHDCLLIAVSGYADAHHQALTRDAGFQHFLAKPVELKALEAFLRAKEECSLVGDQSRSV